MHLFLLACLASGAAAALRNVMYLDQYHTAILPNKSVTAGITHVNIAFANSSLFTTDPVGTYTPFMDVAAVRAMFDSNVKVLIALGGWGDTEGLSAGAADNKSRALYAKNIADTLKTLGLDGVDVDWEYPAGNGNDYKQKPNSEKVSEITTFPLLLKAIRDAIGSDMLLTIAVPGLARDMIAYINATVPSIAAQIDFANVMAYDLMNRRDNVTKHHTDLAHSLLTIETYASLGMPAAQMNLGFAFYAKWFTTADGVDCSAGVGCATAVLEDPVTGADTGLSGAMTFELVQPVPSALGVSVDGTCGAAGASTCEGFEGGECCSQYGSW